MVGAVALLACRSSVGGDRVFSCVGVRDFGGFGSFFVSEGSVA